MKQTFYSPGKLLLTAEYFVLDGAQALAVPCRFGQDLVVSPSETSGITWASYKIEGTLWFEHHFSIEDIKETPKTKPSSIKETLQKILYHANSMNPSFFESLAVTCHTHLEFPRDWGLGSSSTLINNIAQWTKVDAYSLLEKSFGGSGYDIAAAKCKLPFLFSNLGSISTQELILEWNFTDQIFFVHLNQKQDSKEGIERYRNRLATIQLQNSSPSYIDQINSLTQDFVNAENIKMLGLAMEKHENLVADFIGLEPIKQKLFSDYPHPIKSLGAWGGDFFMAIGSIEDRKYFKQKGYKNILDFKEMVLF